jgi:hypothetical protein
MNLATVKTLSSQMVKPKESTNSIVRDFFCRCTALRVAKDFLDPTIR